MNLMQIIAATAFRSVVSLFAAGFINTIYHVHVHLLASKQIEIYGQFNSTLRSICFNNVIESNGTNQLAKWLL